MLAAARAPNWMMLACFSKEATLDEQGCFIRQRLTMLRQLGFG
jgi:hypothetical protein